MADAEDELSFIPEQIEPLCYDVIELVLKDKLYNDSLVQTWIDEISSRINMELIEMNKPFKYIITCVIMQKNGAGIHMGNSAYWDASNDNFVMARWPNEKRKDPNAR